MSDKTLFRIVAAISAFVFIVVVILNQKVLPRPDVMPGFVQFLPVLNATLNGTCAILLLLSLWFIKKKNINMHKRINLTAFVLSALFLVSYILAHYFMPDVKFGDLNHDGFLDDSEKNLVSGVRSFYLLILTTHIILAALVLPAILISFYFGLKNEVVKHKKIVRYTYPVWLYVTITGVAVYLMVKPYYPFQ
jgi:putative membrane protein